MAKSKTREEKLAYIASNLSVVPAKQKTYFEGLDEEKKYKKILQYLRKANKKSETKTTTVKKLNVKSVIKDITSKNPTSTQVQKIIDGLNEWVNDTKQRMVSDLDKQIAELQKQRDNLIK